MRPSPAAAGAVTRPSTMPVSAMPIQNGAEVNAKVKSWNHEVDAIYFAASAKNKSLFEMLLQHGADATDALTPAIWNGDDDLAEPNRTVPLPNPSPCVAQ